MSHSYSGIFHWRERNASASLGFAKPAITARRYAAAWIGKLPWLEESLLSESAGPGRAMATLAEALLRPMSALQWTGPESASGLAADARPVERMLLPEGHSYGAFEGRSRNGRKEPGSIGDLRNAQVTQVSGQSPGSSISTGNPVKIAKKSPIVKAARPVPPATVPQPGSRAPQSDYRPSPAMADAQGSESGSQVFGRQDLAVAKRLRRMAGSGMASARIGSSPAPFPEGPRFDRETASAWYRKWIGRTDGNLHVTTMAPTFMDPAQGNPLASPSATLAGPADSIAAPLVDASPAWSKTLDAILRSPAAQEPRTASPNREPGTEAARGGFSMPPGFSHPPFGKVGASLQAQHTLLPPDPNSPSEQAPANLSALGTALPGVAWLDEDENLAGKLHRLLRRQARRHGVDL